MQVAYNPSDWEEISIGDNVLIGSNATILPVRIVSNVVIGCGAVVTGDILEPGTYVGNPAKKCSAAAKGRPAEAGPLGQPRPVPASSRFNHILEAVPAALIAAVVTTGILLVVFSRREARAQSLA